MTPETTSTNEPSEGSTIVKKSRRQEKPRFQDFNTELQGRISSSIGKDQFADVYKALRKGFQEPITPEHLNQVCITLATWRDFSRFAVKLATEVAVGRPSGLMKRILSQIRRECARRCSFPINEISFVSGRRDSAYLQAILSWVKDQSQATPVNDEFVRNAFVCIINEIPGFEDFCSVQSLLAEADAKIKASQVSKKKALKKNDGVNYYKSYTKQIGAYLSAKKIVATRISLSLTVYQILTEWKMKSDSRIEQLEHQLSRERTMAREYREGLDVSEKERQKLGEEIGELKGQVSLAQRELEKEKERFNVLDEHWTRRLERELKGQSYDFAKSFGHEVREIALSLERENPNLEMALGRVRNMESYLRKMGENQ